MSWSSGLNVSTCWHRRIVGLAASACLPPPAPTQSHRQRSARSRGRLARQRPAHAAPQGASRVPRGHAKPRLAKK
ncbi:hypothetical protein [Providencia rettgeri]|uniref:hypothetical protein n=1 Tax=Providencia rettgeri TaxID=587 RepID=UPI001657D22F|nr:hypothetical protein H9L31_02925 [Providencia rettgeri]